MVVNVSENLKNLWVKEKILIWTFNIQSTLKKKPFENNVGKGENAGNQHSLLFPQCFLPIPKTTFVFKLHFFFVICKCFQFGPV